MRKKTLSLVLAAMLVGTAIPSPAWADTGNEDAENMQLFQDVSSVAPELFGDGAEEEKKDAETQEEFLFSDGTEGNLDDETEGSGTEHDHTDWTVLSSENVGSLSARNYYLENDIETSGSITIPSGMTISICLNGHTIKRTDKGSGGIATNPIFDIQNSATLNLYDCEGKGSIINLAQSSRAFGVKNAGTFNMHGGTIKCSEQQTISPGVSNTGTFNMYAGTITGYGSSTQASGVSNSGTFNMHGGIITGIKNSSTTLTSGGGLSNSGTFNMYGGTIEKNEGAYGGGINNSGGTVVIDGGKISENTAKGDGGGIYNRLAKGTVTINENGVIEGNHVVGEIIGTGDGGGIYQGGGTCYIKGATIQDNAASQNGGGICLSDGEITINGGTIQNNTAGSLGGGIHVPIQEDNKCKIVGTIQLTGNKRTDGKTDNACLYSTIQIIGNLAGSKIGITTSQPQLNNAEVLVTAGESASIPENFREFFFSDNTDYKVMKTEDGTGLYLQKGRVYQFLPGNYATGEAHEIEWDPSSDEGLTFPEALFERTGYVQAGWSSEREGFVKNFDLGQTLSLEETRTFSTTAMYPYWELQVPELQAQDKDTYELSYGYTDDDAPKLQIAISNQAEDECKVYEYDNGSWIDGTQYTYAWYEGNDTTEESKLIEGAETDSFSVPEGLDVGEHKYTVKVTAKTYGIRTSLDVGGEITPPSGGDSSRKTESDKPSARGETDFTQEQSAFHTFTVKVKSTIAFSEDSLDREYTGSPVEEPEVSVTPSDPEAEIAYIWEKKTDEDAWETLEQAPADAGTYRVTAVLAGEFGCSVVKEFTISQAENEWVTPLSISGWTSGQQANAPSAQAKFGEAVFTYSDSADGEYTENVPSAVGSWYVKATVTETENYKGLISDPVSFRISAPYYPPVVTPTPEPIPDNYPEGSERNPDGSIETPNGTVIEEDGTIILPDGTRLEPGEDGSKPSIDKENNVTDINGTVIKGDGTIILPGDDLESTEDDTWIEKGDGQEAPVYIPDTVSAVTKEGNKVTLPGGIVAEPEAGSTVATDGTVTEPDGTIHNPDGSVQSPDGTYLTPAVPMLESAEIYASGNQVRAVLTGECAGAEGYDYVISENVNCIYDKDYLLVSKNIEDIETYFRYVPEGTYYVYCHAWFKDENGKKVFSAWSNYRMVEVTAATPERPRIQNVKVDQKKKTITLTYTRCQDASSYDIILGSRVEKVNGENRPVDYGKRVKKIKNGNTVTVTLRNAKKGTYYMALHAWNRTSEDGTKVFSPWSNIKKIVIR